MNHILREVTVKNNTHEYHLAEYDLPYTTHMDLPIQATVTITDGPQHPTSPTGYMKFWKKIHVQTHKKIGFWG